jgi:hypothetical protein
VLRALVPNVETLGYYRMSLRDKDLPGFAGVLGDQILAALDQEVCPTLLAIMRLPRNLFARIAPMNLKMRKCLIINNRILRFMGRIAGVHGPVIPVQANGLLHSIEAVAVGMEEG